jgi:hypothetical protein
VVVDDFYTDSELADIKQELKDIKRFANQPQESATSKDGSLKNKGVGIFLDKLYQEKRHLSSILTYNRKLFSDAFIMECTKHSPIFNALFLCNKDNTLINYYDNESFYDTHTDISVLTALTFLKFGDFEGGEFVLSFLGNDEVIPFKENRLVLFSGCIEHRTNVIKAQPNNYRISIAQFVNYKHDS